MRIYKKTGMYFRGRRVGWQFICPNCFSVLASGSNDCPAPRYAVCNCTK